MPGYLEKFCIKKLRKKKENSDFPAVPVVEKPPANAGGAGSIPGLGRFHLPRVREAHVP